MMEVLKAIGFMTLGGLLVHLHWLHAWRMYREGKKEGQQWRK